MGWIDILWETSIADAELLTRGVVYVVLLLFAQLVHGRGDDGIVL